MRDFRKIKVWHKAHQVTLVIYHLTKSFPKDELYGMISQMRRASYSIPANIAEGCGRETDNDFARFLTIALGSASELEYFCILAKDLGYISESDYSTVIVKVTEVKRMLTGFIKRLKADD